MKFKLIVIGSSIPRQSVFPMSIGNSVPKKKKCAASQSFVPAILCSSQCSTFFQISKLARYSFRETREQQSLFISMRNSQRILISWRKCLCLIPCSLLVARLPVLLEELLIVVSNPKTSFSLTWYHVKKVLIEFMMNSLKLR